MSKAIKPTIGWMVCTDSFLIVNGKWGVAQPEPISHEAALKHWREGTARFRPFAEKKLAGLARGKNVVFQ
jgi:hypothetical protein